MKKLIISIFLLFSLNSSAVTYPANPFGTTWIQNWFNNNNYYSNTYYYVDWSSVASWASWEYIKPNNNPYDPNAYNEVYAFLNDPFYQNQFNQINQAKANGTLTNEMINNFYGDVDYGMATGTLPTENVVPIDMNFVELFIFFFMLFLTYLIYKRLNIKKP